MTQRDILITNLVRAVSANDPAAIASAKDALRSYGLADDAIDALADAASTKGAPTDFGLGQLLEIDPAHAHEHPGDEFDPLYIDLGGEG